MTTGRDAGSRRAGRESAEADSRESMHSMPPCAVNRSAVQPDPAFGRGLSLRSAKTININRGRRMRQQSLLRDVRVFSRFGENHIQRMAATSGADDTASPIAKDMAWGAAGTPGGTAVVARLLADNVVSVSGRGVADDKSELAATEPAPTGTADDPTDHTLVVMGKDMTIMTHGTKGQAAHCSPHEWSSRSGQRQVIATSATPIEAMK